MLVFANIKIVLMISAFLGINLVFFWLSLDVIIKAATSFMHSDTGRLAIKAVKYFV